MFRGKILAITDSATATSGYGVQANEILSRLAKRGWDVYQFAGNCFDLEQHAKLESDGYYHYNGIKLIKNDDVWKKPELIYPSKEKTTELYTTLKPDIVWTLNDFYRVAGLTDADMPKGFIDRWVHWLPIDNIRELTLGINYEKKMKYLAFMSSFGYENKVGYLDEVPFLDAVYLAVSSETFKPLDKIKIKAEKNYTDKFVILTVGKHQVRKMIYNTAEVVGEFLSKHKDAIWVCKTNPNDECMKSYPEEKRNLMGIMKKWGVEDRATFIPERYSSEQMNELYNSADIFIHLSGGEGFGLPCVESMLAGTPCILSDNTTSPELTGGQDFGLLVPTAGTEYVEVLKVSYDTPNKKIGVEKLEFVYNDWKTDKVWLNRASEAGIKFHKQWCDPEKIVDHWEDIFQRMIRNINKVLWMTHYGSGTGFSNLSESIIPELEELGYDMYCMDWSGGNSPAMEVHTKELWEKYLKAKPTINFEEYPQVQCWLMDNFPDVKGKHKIGWAFTESTKLRAHYKEMCNSMDYIVTSTDFTKNVMKESGIIVPLHTIPPCINSEQFPEFERITTASAVESPFTFLHIGVVQERKNTEQMLDGYVRAFPDNGKTKFIIKSNHFGKLDSLKQRYSDRTDIEWIYTDEVPLTREQLLNLYRRADCYVNISHGEGIGLPDMEAMATGLPVIGSNWDSRGTFLDDEVGWMVKNAYMAQAYTMVPEDCGQWMHYDGQDYIRILQYAATHRDECKSKGHKAAERIHSKFTAKQAALAMDNLLMDVYRKKRETANTNQYDENYYTNVHKYTPDWHENAAQAILGATNNLQGKVLDIGCGRGYIMKHLLAHGVNIEGIESSDYAVANPMDECKGKIRKGDAAKIDSANQSYDWGIAYSLMEHIPEQYVDGVLKEIARTCKKCYFQIAMSMYLGHENQLRFEDSTHCTVHTYDWWKGRFTEAGLKITWYDNGMCLIAEPLKYETKAVSSSDRILVGIPTKDRLQSIKKTMDSLQKQTFKNFDIFIIDDSIKDQLHLDTELKGQIDELSKSGICTALWRGAGRNQAIAHNHIMNHAIEAGYKLVFRCDDDITLEPDHIEKLFNEFVKDTECKYAAMGGIILNPYDKGTQMVPNDWRTNPAYAGTMNPCVYYAQIQKYPDEIEFRDDIQHLYSSYMYRPELMASVGGFPSDLSSIALREETLGLYELYLKGYKMKIVCKALAYHWHEATGGCRAIKPEVAQQLYASDEELFKRRVKELNRRYTK